MSKYEAVPSPLYADYWHVRWPTGGNSEPFTEAEANIIAFALNAIADGRELVASPLDISAGYVYDGPTDGVAP